MNSERGASLDTDRDRAVGKLIREATGDADCPEVQESVEPVDSTEDDPRALPQIAKGHYAKFARGLKGWSVFEGAARSNGHWFRDLLSLWRPSGHCSGTDGLRVAIRDGYLNFYRLGQSIARVACVSGELVADVHYKYVLGEQPGYSGPLYLRLTKEGIFSRGRSAPAYKDLDTLRGWILAAKRYAGVEKKIVDKLVAMNDHVIDLEMAIPAWKQPKVAVRMDLVAIENGKVVFWEAKTVDDSRIRCRAEFEEDKFPHVLKQLSQYRVFLEQKGHSEQVELAYLETAGLLVKLRDLADKIGPALALGDSIRTASEASKLEVARQAALVVVDLLAPEDKKGAWASWKAIHEGKLRGRIPMCVLESPGPLVLEDNR